MKVYRCLIHVLGATLFLGLGTTKTLYGFLAFYAGTPPGLEGIAWGLVVTGSLAMAYGVYLLRRALLAMRRP